MRLILNENSSELDTCAPHTGEFECVGDAKRAADRRQEFISTELTIEDEVGNLIAYRPGIRPWVDCINPGMLGRWPAGRSRHGGRGVGAPKRRSESELRA